MLIDPKYTYMTMKNKKYWDGADEWGYWIGKNQVGGLVFRNYIHIHYHQISERRSERTRQQGAINVHAQISDFSGKCIKWSESTA